MTNPLDLPFYPGREEPAGGPLARYLPPVPPGMVSTWLADHVPAGSWVLDPFGGLPAMAVEAAQAGYRVLVAANNPIPRFILEVTAAAPARSDFQAALAELAAARKGNERLEPHIQSLYQTECASCKRTVPAEAFLWEKGAKFPYARLVHCPYCDDQGERPVTPEDIERLSEYSGTGLTHARALERVSPADDPTRADVEEALGCYLARPLYALFTLINKLEGLAVPPPRRALLTALLLSACDQANTLWNYPSARARPKQLAVPTRFRENNLWMVLEAAVTEWTGNPTPVPVCAWPEQPPAAGGISIYQGRLKDLAASLAGIPVQAIAAALPRPNQAFWTQSALWSGWIWGREAVAPLKSVLSRRRYDWNWHAGALEAALSSLIQRIQPGVPFFGVLAEYEPAFLSAALVAGSMAGFSLQGLALRPEQALGQVTWMAGAAGPSSSGSQPEVRARAAVAEVLARRGEPSPFAVANAAAVAALTMDLGDRKEKPQPAADALARLQGQVRHLFLDRGFLVRFGGGEHTLESGLWWPVAPHPPQLALFDRVEMDVVLWLQKNPGCTYAALDRALCASNPGLNTPSGEMIRACLESYAVEEPRGGGCWYLRPQDSPALRQKDILEARRLLGRLGEGLGYRVDGETPLLWEDAGSQPDYVFYILASTLVGRFINQSPYPPDRCVIVLPGSRSNLMAIKLRTNPVLNRTVQAGWRFLKYRHLRSLADNPLLNRGTWSMQLGSDPPEYQSEQMNMF